MFAAPRTRPTNTQKRSLTSGPAQARPNESLMNNQRREKLKSLLVNRYIKFFGSIADEEIIEKEVSAFIKRDKLTERDLKTLEKNLKIKLTNKKDITDLRSNLVEAQNNRRNAQLQNNTNNLNTALPNINSYKSANNILQNNLPLDRPNRPSSAHSNMSGGSDLDKFNEVGAGDQQLEEDKKNFKKMSQVMAENEKNYNKTRPNIDYSKYNDEWDALNMYNKYLFQQQKINNKIKDKEVKARTKADLDFQVKEKLLRQYQEKLKEKEMDVINVNHLKHLEELEKIKNQQVKERLLKEKESRFQQIKDGQIRRRIEFLKNRKYERGLVESLKEAMEADKAIAIEKKIKENEALKKTLKDNEIHKQRVAEEMKKEREADIKMIEDDAKIKERQENERILYFKNIERSANSFADAMVKTVIKEQNLKNEEEDRQIELYNKFRDQQYDENERKKMLQIQANKKMLKEYYDRQVNEKKLKKAYEKEVDKAQARVWIKDAEMNDIMQKEVKKTIFDMNVANLDLLKRQIESDKLYKNAHDQGMNDYEKKMNKEALEKANEINIQ